VIVAQDLADVYRAATALVREILVGESVVEPREYRALDHLGEDAAEALFRYLRELLYLYDCDGFLAAEVVGLGEGVRGELFDPARHEPAHQVKAVTRHLYELEGGPDGYRAHVVFDL
jgi:SHS2 domain-containing protein